MYDTVIVCTVLDSMCYTFLSAAIRDVMFCSKSVNRLDIIAMYMCIFIKLHITAQSGPVIRVILCHSHCMYVWSSHAAKIRINRVRLPILFVVS